MFVGQDGQRAVHGFGLASQFFFSQPLAELKLHQVALLVGMVKGPSSYNPRRNPERALVRRNLVLDLLEQQGVATPEQVAAAKKMPLGVTRAVAWQTVPSRVSWTWSSASYVKTIAMKT